MDNFWCQGGFSEVLVLEIMPMNWEGELEQIKKLRISFLQQWSEIISKRFEMKTAYK